MKIRNKKSGEVYELNFTVNGDLAITKPTDGEIIVIYTSLAELNEEWEDTSEEPKEYWYIYANKPQRAKCGDFLEEDFKEIGNYFETKEEAEKAVEKLKAWKRLKDNGITFSLDEDGSKPFIRINSKKETGTLRLVLSITEDLTLLFGGEE